MVVSDSRNSIQIQRSAGSATPLLEQPLGFSRYRIGGLLLLTSYDSRHPPSLPQFPRLKPLSPRGQCQCLPLPTRLKVLGPRVVVRWRPLVSPLLYPVLSMYTDFVIQEDYLIQVTMAYVEQARGPPARGSKILSKERTVTKMVNAPLRGISRAEFVHVFLNAHALGDEYAAGPHSGPLFRLWWTGVK